MTLCIVGFDDLVTSFVATIATGWSDPCRVGLSPTEKPRLYAAHWKSALVDFENPVASDGFWERPLSSSGACMAIGALYAHLPACPWSLWPIAGAICRRLEPGARRTREAPARRGSARCTLWSARYIRGLDQERQNQDLLQMALI